MATHILAERIELIESTLNATARTVDVVLIRPGWSANGRYYSPGVLAQAAALFEGTKAYANHPTREQLKRGEGRSVLDITGDYTNVRIGEAGELRATRTVYGKAGEAVWPLIERTIETKRPVIGVSINALGKASKGTAPDGKEGVIVESIDVANSADDVDTPAAGGGFESLLMGDDSLLRDLLSTLTYEEFIEARPDYMATARKQFKRAAQDDQTRALISERDAAQTALIERTAERDTAVTDLETARAEIARLTRELTLTEAFKACKFKPDYERLLREQLDRTPLDQWQNVLSLEIQKAKATRLGQTSVAVHGVPLREAVSVQTGGRSQIGPVNPDHYASPQAFYEEVQRRKRALGAK